MPHRLNKIVLLLLVSVYACLLPSGVFAQVQINGIIPTESTCANNGTITVNAVSAAPPLVYSLTAGPVTAPIQTNNVFNSLPPGMYTVAVTDGATNIQSQTVTVPGSYLPPDFAPLKTMPYCPGQSNGQLVGNRTAGAGFGPYTWQLIAPSPVVTAPQASDTFNNLSAGNYTMRLTDACGGFRTVVTTLNDPPAANISFVVPPAIAIIGCDSALLTMNLHADVFRFPLTCIFVTSAGTFTTTANTFTDTTSSCCGYFGLGQVLPGVTYSGSVQVSITDACGNTFISPVYYAKPFRFCTSTSPSFNNCVYSEVISFNANNAGCDFTGAMNTSVKPPLDYEVRDAISNAVVASGTAPTYNNGYGYTLVNGFSVEGLPPNRQYIITATDGCGKVSTQNYFVNAVVPPTPSVSSKSVYPDGCVDSTAFAFVFVDSFPKEPKLVFLSGPSRMGSTKPGYEYENHYVYPDTLPVLGYGSATFRFDISNLSVGTYHFKVIDSCGTELYDSLVIAPADVTNFSHDFSYKKGCLGQNEIHYNILAPNGQMFINNSSGTVSQFLGYQSQDWATPIRDSIMNLPSGTYQLTFMHQGYFGVAASAAADPVVCTVIRDSIVIEGYQTPAIIANNYIQCRSSTFLELLADSSKGVPPYQYEIISGPQTFPIQASNLFTLTAAGTYTVRIYDVCGNGSAAQITVDPIAFPPITTLPFGCNSTSLTYGASAFYTYDWTAPNGTVFTGDTLRIDPVTPADTGVYHIRKIVNINGCIDTFNTTHYIGLNNITTQTMSICTGDFVTVGTHVYAATGVYTDTLVNSNQCDSIVVLNLTVTAIRRDTTRQAVCAGSSYLFNGNAYTQTGFYSDTLKTGACDSIIVLQLTVNPLKRDTIFRSICVGQSYFFNGVNLTTAGSYLDTITTPACDSIVLLNLSVDLQKKDSIVRAACEGQGYMFNGTLLTLPGIYRDTLTTATCDSIIILNLSFYPQKRDTIVQTICLGQSYTFNGNVLTQTGIYFDTIPTPTCDSLVILSLGVTPILIDTAFQTICEGFTYFENGQSYSIAGDYNDTIPNGACYRINVLHLSVIPRARDTVSRTICLGDTVVVNGHAYTQSGTYTDTLISSSCDRISTLFLSVIPTRSVQATANPDSIDAGGTVQLTVTSSTTYLWTSPAALINNPQIQNPTATLTAPAWIYVTTTGAGFCDARDSVFIRVNVPPPCLGSYIFMPNAFTPNGDTHNDAFKAESQKNSLNYFMIFNRWGEKVFETTDIRKGWDGYYKGDMLPGAYVYVVSYHSDCDTVTKMIKGSFLLIN